MTFLVPVEVMIVDEIESFICAVSSKCSEVFIEVPLKIVVDT
jgi:hypothetical protein